MIKLEDYLKKIERTDKKIEEKVKKRWDLLFKPVDGLGIFEEMIAKIGAIQESEHICLEKKAVVVMCSDNGVIQEKVTQSGKEITQIVAKNMALGESSINHMARTAGAEVFPIDIGMNILEPIEEILDRKIAAGTKNILQEPAMTRKEAEKAILTGISVVKELQQQGFSILATGEMGIGNTTTSSAVSSVLLQVPPEKITGQGAGLCEEGLKRKIEVIEQAILFHQSKWKENGENDVIEILRCLGGFDLAGLMGIFLGGAIFHVPVVMDGLISQTAALLAVRYCPSVIDYILPSHIGKEPASQLLLEALQLKPVIQGELKLGEGTGAVLLFPMLDMALSVYDNQPTFKEQAIDAYQRF